ncbi:hypothetical protein [Limosilactobacillus reuteri]|uniref:hypothetical protein n=1 Tax=Limosilactobacillus reuteri TaxID=1598 RepID=UPI00109484CF|nr:hypothetical protein [Limosilactobacillus reuteri]TGY57162.1 hypothetical protein E5337_09050 [Limosilactobacillus reuteri]
MSELNTYLKQLNKAHDDYEAKFGKGSLDDVIPYFDPVNPEIDNVQEGIRILRDAIENNKPLPKFSNDLKSDIIY